MVDRLLVSSFSFCCFTQYARNEVDVDDFILLRRNGIIIQCEINVFIITNASSLCNIQINCCFGKNCNGYIDENEHKCLKVLAKDRGHVKVRTGAHLFYWLLRKEAVETDPHTIPLAIYLAGGPGDSATGVGNFQIFGPCNIELEERKTTWLNHMHVLLIDSPVGVGFSYFTDYEKAATTDELVVDDLHVLLIDFFNKHEDMKTAPLHIIGTSYGAKTAVQLALRLQEKPIGCNLKSVTSIAGWISPTETVLAYAPFIRQTGFIDQHGFATLNVLAEKVKQALDAEDFRKAAKREAKLFRMITTKFGVNANDVRKHKASNEHAESNTDIFIK